MTTLRERYPVLVDNVLATGQRAESASLKPGGLVSSDTLGKIVGELTDSPLISFADQELGGLVSSDAWDRIVEELTDIALTLHDRMGDLFPGLDTWFDVGIQDAEAGSIIEPLSARTFNCLNRANKSTWGAVASSTVESILELRNFGIRSARELFGACVRLGASTGPDLSHIGAFGGLGPNPDGMKRLGVLWDWLEHRRLRRVLGPPMAAKTTSYDRGAETTQSPQAVGSSNLQSAAEFLQLVLAWAASEHGATRIGDVCQLSSAVGEMPDDVAARWKSFSELDLAVLAELADLTSDLDTLVRDITSVLDSRQRLVLERRVLCEKRKTLREVAEELGITRERVRQIQVKLERRLAELTLLPRFRVVRWRALTLSSALGETAPIDADATSAAINWAIRGASRDSMKMLRALILRLAGGYEEKDGWLVREDGPEINAATLAKLGDEIGLLPLETAYAWLSEQGIVPPFYDAWLERCGHFRRIGDTLVVWTGSIVDKCISLLALHGSPTDADTLIDEVGEGHNVVGARNRFFEDERLMRISRSGWALRAWGLEEYTGITDEIHQRIDEHGGRVRLSELVDELVNVFDVKEGSVRVYAAAPMFVIEDEWVRLRREEEPYVVAESLSGCKGVYRSSESVISMVVPVDQDTLRGSGRTLPSAVAVALGVTPDRSRVFRGATARVSVTWPKTSAMGPSLGSTRSLAVETGASGGERIRLDFDVQKSTVSAIRVGDSSDGGKDRHIGLQLLTGIRDVEADPMHLMARAIGVAPEAVRHTLVSRDDSEVAELLPVSEIDSGLEAALEDLAGALERNG